MTCRRVKARLVFFAYGELDEPGRKAVEGHLEVCPDCRQELERLLRDKRVMTDLSGEVPAFESPRTWKAIQAGMKGEVKRSGARRRLLTLAPRAAVLVFVFMAGFFIAWALFRSRTAVRPEQALSLHGLIQDHLEAVGSALMEFQNSGRAAGEDLILTQEKEKIQELLFMNRTLRHAFRQAPETGEARFWNELEIILLEVANLPLRDENSLREIRAMIRERDVLFQIRYWTTGADRTSP